ncbi:MAG TPA: hypothetical protein VK742_09305 [Candidatus Sulfotelmatobacter sp.]|nr:hypothetical protein [Candidatus Sulfotelmatobacter sp.]
MEQDEPRIGLAGIACAISFMLAFPAVQYLSGFTHDTWSPVILAFFIPIMVTFLILHSSAWHLELSPVTRILSMLLSALIIYAVVLAMLALAVMAAAMFFGNGMVST